MERGAEVGQRREQQDGEEEREAEYFYEMHRRVEESGVRDQGAAATS